MPALQVSGILWAASQAWNLPPTWFKFSRWVVGANLDLLMLAPKGAPMGSTNRDDLSVWGEQPGCLQRYMIPVGKGRLSIVQSFESHAHLWHRFCHPFLASVPHHGATSNGQDA